MRAFLLSLLIFASQIASANAYTQTPRSCGDPRTQFPSYPPCQNPQFLSLLLRLSH